MGFCPICGKNAVDTFCEDCTKEREPLIADIRPIKLIKCSTCDRIKVSGRYQDMNNFEHFVKKHIKLNKNADVFEVLFPRPIFDEKPKSFDLPIEVYGSASKNIDPYVEEYEVHVELTLESCDRCNLSRSKYFEGILQLRNPRDEVVTYIEKAVQKNKDVFITKATDVKGGIDFQFTDQKYLHQFSHELHKKFGGEMKVRSKLFSKDKNTSKDIYRLTTMLRLPKFWAGDIIETPKRLVKISRMGVMLHGFDLKRRKNTTLACPSEGDYDVLEEFETVVSAVTPKVTILDPEDYQPVEISHPANLEAGQKVNVVQDSNDKWYVTSKC